MTHHQFSLHVANKGQPWGKKNIWFQYLIQGGVIFLWGFSLLNVKPSNCRTWIVLGSLVHFKLDLRIIKSASWKHLTCVGCVQYKRNIGQGVLQLEVTYFHWVLLAGVRRFTFWVIQHSFRPQLCCWGSLFLVRLPWGRDKGKVDFCASFHLTAQLAA